MDIHGAVIKSSPSDSFSLLDNSNNAESSDGIDAIRGGAGALTAELHSSQQQRQVQPKLRTVHVFTPLRFSYVTPEVSRGAYPTLPCFRYLHRLGLKTIVSITPEPPSGDIVDLCELLGIKLVHIQALHTASIANLTPKAIKAVNILIQPGNVPAFLHCLDGRRVTSVVVLLLRRVQGWTCKAAMEEFWRFQMPILQDVTASDVDRIEADLEKLFATLFSYPTGGVGSSDDAPENTLRLPPEIPSWIWNGDRAKAVAMLYRGKTDKGSAAATVGLVPQPSILPSALGPSPHIVPVPSEHQLQDLLTLISAQRPPMPGAPSGSFYSLKDPSEARSQQHLFTPVHSVASGLGGLDLASAPGGALGIAVSGLGSGRLRRSTSGTAIDRASPGAIFDSNSVRRYEGVGELVTFGSGDGEASIRSTRSHSPMMTPRGMEP